MAKKEYHNLVSPIVLNGGLPKLNQSPAMNDANTANAIELKTIANVLLLLPFT